MDEAQTCPPPGRCPVHDVDATRLCERCGSYTCDTCDDGGAERVCRACRQRVDLSHFPIERATFSVSAVLETSREVFAEHWGTLTAATFGYYVITTLVSFFRNTVAGETPVVGLGILFVEVALSSFLMLGLLAMAHAAVEGRIPSGILFTQGAKLWRALVVWVLVWLGYMVPGLLVMVPVMFASVVLLEDAGAAPATLLTLVVLVPFYIYLALGIWFSLNAIVYEDLGPIAAVRRSWSLVSGYRWPLLGLSILCVLLLIAGGFACCVGVVPATAFFFVVQTVAYRGLANGTERRALPPKTF